MSEQDPVRLGLTAAQVGVWVAHHLDPDSPAHNCATAFDVPGPLDAALLAVAVAATVRESEALGVLFAADRAHPWQVPAAAAAQPAYGGLDVVDLAGAPDPAAAVEAWMRADLDRPGDLRTGPLVRHALLRTAADRCTVYVRNHHILLDGFGHALHCRRLAGRYSALAAGEPCGGPQLHRPLDALLAEERTYTDSPRRAADRRYWRDALAGLPDAAPPPVPTAMPSPVALRSAVQVPFPLVAGPAGPRRWSMVVLAAAAAYLHRLAGGGEEVVLGLPLACRLSAAALATPAMLTNELPLRVPVRPEATLTDLVRDVTDRVGDVLRHQRYRAEDLYRDLGVVDGGVHHTNN